MNKQPLPPNFNWKFYIETYPDLKRCGILTQKQAELHYTIYGSKEGRKYCSEDPISEHTQNSGVHIFPYEFTALEDVNLRQNLAINSYITNKIKMVLKIIIPLGAMI